MYMKTAIMIILVLVAAVAMITFIQAETEAQERRSLEEEPNFKPKITQAVMDGRQVEIIEFKSKFAE